MKILIVGLALSLPAFPVTIPTLAGALSIVASSGQIVRETHDLTTHFKRTMKKYIADLKKAAKGKR